MTLPKKMAMTQSDKAFYERCDTFKDYADIDAYMADICRWLTLSDWHYSADEAYTLVNRDREFVEHSFQERTPCALVAADIGYVCG